VFRYCSYISILLLIIMALSGCTGQMEIDRISFPVAIGIDFDETNNNIKVYAQISTTSSNPGGQPQTKKTYKILEGKGDTLLDAMADITSKSSQNISWKQITVVVITEKLGKHGFSNELDLLCRFQQIHMNSYLMITDEDIKELLESTPTIESSLPSPLGGIRLISEQSSHTKTVTIREFAMAYLNDGMEPIIPKISIIKSGEKEIIIDFTCLSVFKDDKLVGDLNEDETRGAVLIYGRKNISHITIPKPENGKQKEFTIHSIKSTPKIIPGMQQNMQGITLKLEIEYILAQSSIPAIIDTTEVDRINKQVEEYITESVKTAIHKTQKELSADIFGFGQKIYRKYPKYWLENKDHWNDIFPNIIINVEVKANLIDTGNTLNSLEYWNKKG
jgi:spore germination protein KC